MKKPIDISGIKLDLTSTNGKAGPQINISGVRPDYSEVDRQIGEMRARKKEEGVAIQKLESGLASEMAEALSILSSLRDISGGALVHLALIKINLEASGHNAMAQNLGHVCAKTKHK